MILCCTAPYAQTFSSSVFNNADSDSSADSEYEDSSDDYYDDDYADEDEEDDYYGGDDEDYYDEEQRKHEENDPVSYTHYRTRKGDQFLKVGIAGNIPLSFGNPWFTADGKMQIGGLLSIGYHYFLTKYFAVGGDIGFGFNPTIGGNIFSHIPVMLTATFQPAFGSFEFPLTIGVGAAWETYNSEKYWPGLVVRPEAGVYYRINESWAAGGNVAYKFMPQFGQLWGKSDTNIMGHYVEIEASVKYYF